MNQEPVVNQAKKKKNKKKKGSQGNAPTETQPEITTEKPQQPEQKDILKPNLNLPKPQDNFLEYDDQASRSSRSTSTEAAEIRPLNRQEELLRETFNEKMKEVQEKFNAKAKLYVVEYTQEVQKDFTHGLYRLSAQELTTQPTGRPPKSANEKNFQYRESLLNTMFEQNENIRTLYNMAIAAMSILFVNFFVYEYTQHDTLIDWDKIKQLFNEPGVVFNIWIRIFFLHLAIIPFTRWVHYSRPSKLIWVSIYIAAHFYNFYYALESVYAHHINFASSLIVLIEATRMGMKSHSYLRNKLLYASDIWEKYRYFIPANARKAGVKESDLYIPDIKFHPLSKEVKKYLYFLFAPTLLYRDKYVRAPKVHYGKVIFHYVNFFLCIYYGYMLYKIFVLPLFENTGKDTGDFLDFVLSILSSVMPGITSLVMLFFGLLHSFFNAFAELMRFPDRHFYEDWWNVVEFGAYYRKWNIVVHEWLYYYVYWDVPRFTGEKVGRGFSQILTFLISAVVHEVIIAGAMGFFYPILFIIFTGPGILLIRTSQHMKSAFLNIVFWICLFLGTGVLFVLYSREYFARKDGNVDPERWGPFWYAVAPRALLLALEQSSK